MRKTRISLFSVIGALAAMLAMTALSSANHRAHINIRVDPDRPFFHGVIQSDVEACEDRRYVYVKRVQPGRNPYVGYDVSSLRGAWSVDVNAAGKFVIKIFAYGGCGGDKKVVVSPGQ